MKLSFLFTALVAFSSNVDSLLAGGVQVFEGVLNSKECEAFAQEATSSTAITKLKQEDDADSGNRPRLQGVADLSLALARRMYQAMHPYGGCRCSSASGSSSSDDKVQVPTSTITATTPVHQDRYRNGKLASEQVGFVVLNSNPDASFVYGHDDDDDQQVVPVKKGSLVAFQGDVPHHTVVTSGQVHLLGPFAMSSFLPVGVDGGDDDDDDDDDDDGEFCAPCAESCSDGFVCSCLSESSGGFLSEESLPAAYLPVSPPVSPPVSSTVSPPVVRSRARGLQLMETAFSTCSSKGSKGGDTPCVANSGLEQMQMSECPIGNCRGLCSGCPDREFYCECTSSKSGKGGSRNLHDRPSSTRGGASRGLSMKSSKGACLAMSMVDMDKMMPAT